MGDLYSACMWQLDDIMRFGGTVVKRAWSHTPLILMWFRCHIPHAHALTLRQLRTHISNNFTVKRTQFHTCQSHHSTCRTSKSKVAVQSILSQYHVKKIIRFECFFSRPHTKQKKIIIQKRPQSRSTRYIADTIRLEHFSRIPHSK